MLSRKTDRSPISQTHDNQKVLKVGFDCVGIGSSIDAIQAIFPSVDIYFASDVDGVTRRHLQANFRSIGDAITDLRAREHEDCVPVDVCIAGFPCQPFSSLGKRKAYSDSEYRDLIYDIIDYITHAKPTMFVKENVKNFAFVWKGNVSESASNSPSSIKGENRLPGYDVSHRVLKATSFGMPQSRSRLCITGAPDGSDPIRIGGFAPMRPISEFLEPRCPCDDPSLPANVSEFRG